MNNQENITTHFIVKKQAAMAPVNLSLLIENELFMYAIFTQDYKELIELCNIGSHEITQHGNSVVDRVNFLINNHLLAGKVFQNVNISVLSSDFTILPESFDLKENSKAILEFSSGSLSKNAFVHKFSNLSFNYGIESELIQFLEKTFKKATIRHAGTVSINLLFNNRSLKKCDLLLNFNEGIFELLAKENNSLLYYNIFNYESKEDVMYFILFMIEQFNLDPNKVKLAIAGQMSVESEVYKGIKKYIKNIEFAVNDISLHNVTGDLKIPNHFYFTVLNQHLCEL